MVVGVRRSKKKERSGRTVTRAGIGTPTLMWAVRALNSYFVQDVSGEREISGHRKSGAHLAKVHTLDTLATQRGTDWGTGAGLASADNQLDELVLLQRISGHD